jgi:hypothetical protein
MLVAPESPAAITDFPEEIRYEQFFL